MPPLKYKKGMKVGPLQLEILERFPKGKVHIICPHCGNKDWYPRVGDVVNGKSTNCGCKNRERISDFNKSNYKDLSNQRFGFLIALNPTKKRQNTYVVWDCLCILCGRHHKANSHDLQKGNVKSCGCWKGSSGEEKIKKLFDNNNINYETQKSFEYCKNILPLRFDFYLPDYNCCIEYNGPQHYQSVDFWGGQEKYEERIKLDKIKEKYCLENQIKLFTIPYWDYDKIDLKYFWEKGLKFDSKKG